MTGSIPDVHPLQAALLYSFEHARQDLANWTEGLSTEQLWRQSGEVAPVAFHILHIMGSVERLLTYALGKQLSDDQMRELRAEQELQKISRDTLLARLDSKLQEAGETVRSLDVSNLRAVCEIGRKRIPVPLGVLLAHIAEHTQRHVGEAIITAKIARGFGETEASPRIAN